MLISIGFFCYYLILNTVQKILGDFADSSLNI